MKNSVIRLENLSMDYGGKEVLDNLSLEIGKNEFFTLLGPSGCGKTTTLRIIGGFENPTCGSVFFDGKNITDVPSNKRNLNTVFQRYALFPHLDVFDNIAFGLKIKKTDQKVIKEKVKSMLNLVGLAGYENRSIDQLSGGEQQRIAIARALVNEPEVLLLDEPLGALDLKLRKEMQIELKNIQQRLGITFIYVTHDQEEALTMSDRIMVMNKGYAQQIGTPIDIYNEPVNRFVADFIGESNIIDGIMIKDRLVSFAGVDFICVDGGFGENAPVDVVIRPEDIKLSPNESGMLSGMVESILFKGVHYEIIVAAAGFKWKVHSTLKENIGDKVYLAILPDDIHIMHKGGDN
ncbi:MAG: ABC transporter ATP-binding protein [Eubacteriales bacterium]|nr:ABC transporter ATP-binding protein [Eubacteriales bacterium]